MYNKAILHIFIFILVINFCNNRELESPEEILHNLYEILNEGFNPNKTIIINKNYIFNITFIQPILRYTKYNLGKDLISIIEPKLVLFFTTLLYIKQKTCFSNKKESYNSISVNIAMILNLSNIHFNKLSDNSYILNYFLNDDIISESVKLNLNFLEDYFFSENDITLEEKSKFFNIYFDSIKERLITYPICDGYFLFTKIQEYILNNRKFNSIYLDDYYTVDHLEIISFKYGEYTKVEKIKSQFLNVNIQMNYFLCTEFVCLQEEKECIINEITIFENNFIFGKSKSLSSRCDENDIFILNNIFNTSKEAIFHLL